MMTVRWKKRVMVALLLGMSVTFFGTVALLRSVQPGESHVTSHHVWKTNNVARVTEFRKPTEPFRHTARHTMPPVAVKVDQQRGAAATTVKPRIEGKGGKAGEQLGISQMRDHALKLNIEEKVLNLEKFPEGLNDDGIILAVQVHNRSEYFKYFITSLQSVKNIEKALVIISHDFYSQEMEQLVAAINFCRVVQIFYPYSMQLYPDKFPGQDPNDCPRDVPRGRAKEIGCNNADHPDQYGHYREAKFTMTKHHWWWKVNHIFDHMRLTQGFSGYVVFLEEDHYLSPDFFHMASMLAKQKLSICPNCDLIGLGTYDKVKDYRSSAKFVRAYPWVSGKHNMGFAINRHSWNDIRRCNQLFCNFDDYNWDWTLQSLGKRCFNRPIGVLVVQAPHVFHIGQCGVHHKQKPGTVMGQCNADSVVSSYRDILQNNQQHLFPEQIALVGTNTISFTSRLAKPEGYGGWGDVRDHQLCSSYANASHIFPRSN